MPCGPCGPGAEVKVMDNVAGWLVAVLSFESMESAMFGEVAQSMNPLFWEGVVTQSWTAVVTSIVTYPATVTGTDAATIAPGAGALLALTVNSVHEPFARLTSSIPPPSTRFT